MLTLEIGQRVEWEYKGIKLAGTVQTTKIIEPSAESTYPLPAYQRVEVEWDKNEKHVNKSEGAARNFNPIL